MRAWVTGATGFLGGALARRLKRLGHQVTGSGRDLTRGAMLERAGIRFRPAALEDAKAALALAKGKDWVFHCGALSSAWGSRQAFEQANIVGTRAVLQAALKARVKRFIHVSSPSVCMDDRDRLNIAEDEPLPPRPVNDYAWSKRNAEEAVQIAAGRGLPVVILRPQAIFGPGDTALFPRILRIAARGSFPQIGGKSLVDVTCIENAVDACVLAARTRGLVSGALYHISNGDAQDIDAMLDRVFARLGMRVRRPHLPFGAAWVLASVLEAGHRVFAPAKEPLLTRYSVLVLARSRTLDIRKARRELGYRPRVSVAEGIERFARHVEAGHGH